MYILGMKESHQEVIAILKKTKSKNNNRRTQRAQVLPKGKEYTKTLMCYADVCIVNTEMI